MNIRTFLSSALVIAMGFAPALPVAALAVGVGHASTVDVDVSDSGVSVGASSDTAARVKHHEEAENNGGSDERASSTAESDKSSIIVLTRDDVDAADQAHGENADLDEQGPEESAQVKNDEDLSAFVAAQIKDDDNVSQIQTSPESVALTYKDEGRFLGIIPATLYATAIVDAGGNVVVTYPWYDFFFATPHKADLESHLKTDVASGLNASSTTQLSAAEQAKLISEIRSAMEATITANADANIH